MDPAFINDSYTLLFTLKAYWDNSLVRLSRRREDESIGRTYRSTPKYQLDIRVELMHSSPTGRAPFEFFGGHDESHCSDSLCRPLLDETPHACAFFNSDDREYRVLLPFINDRLVCDHKAIHVVNPDQQADHLQRLAAAGVNPATAQQSGQLELRTNTDVYLPDGRFEQDRMLEVFEQLPAATSRTDFRSVAFVVVWTGR